MNFRFGFSLFLVLVLNPSILRGALQDWDPVKSAAGWASFDRDGSCVFQDPAGHRLLVWSRDTGVTEEVPLTKVPGQAGAWVLDSSGNAWVASGTVLNLVDRTGKVLNSHNLPAEVGDLAWDTRTFLLSYRTQEPYLQLRDMKSGSLLWSYGTKPPKGASPAPIRHHVAIMEDGRILLNTGDGFQLDMLDPVKGAHLATLIFRLKGQPTPALHLDGMDRGTLAWWLNNNTALMAISAAQLPAGDLQGLVLARLDLEKRELTLVPTGQSDKAALVGIQDGNAVLRSPSGGLVFFPIP